MIYDSIFWGLVVAHQNILHRFLWFPRMSEVRLQVIEDLRQVLLGDEVVCDPRLVHLLALQVHPAQA